MPIPAEVFLSHASSDRSVVEALAAVLDRHGIPFWYSTRNLRGAQQWHDEIGNALARCDWMIVLLSKSSVRSKWVKREVLYALDDDRYEGHILPVRVDDSDYRRISWTLKQFQMIDLRSADAHRTLLECWNLGLRQ